MSLKLQIVSDIHLEFDRKITIESKAPILCLLGDICVCGTTNDYKTFLRFLDYIYPKFKKIIHVPGNHEYYSGYPSGRKLENCFQGINSKLNNLSKKYPNYVFMSNNIHKLKVDNKLVYIVGTTLWSFIPQNKRKYVNDMMNDYEMLFIQDEIDPKKTRRWNANDTVKMHKNSVSLIKKAATLAKKNNVNCILLTHHKPIMDGEKTELQFCYESDLAHLIKPPYILTAHGHTHKRYNKKINNILCVSNPRGYPGDQKQFDPNFCIEIPL